tara:strand:- start:574 stop:768 length:195 start_codon:yes stop_codon:yes gene_type:complete
LTLLGVSYILPVITLTERYKMELEKTIDSLIKKTKLIALLEMKNKIQEEIDKIEEEKEDETIPF